MRFFSIIRSALGLLSFGLALGGWGLGSARASIVIVAPTATVAGSLQITADIPLTISQDGQIFSLILNELVTSFDSAATYLALSPSIAYTVNSGGVLTQSGKVADNARLTTSAITPNDGVIMFNTSISLLAGDVFTFKAGTYSIPVSSAFNPQTTQTFNGDVFLTISNGSLISNTVMVPEPAAAGLCAVGLLLAGGWRRVASRGRSERRAGS